MTITEIGLLKLKPPMVFENPEFQAKMAEIKKWLQDYTGKESFYLQQVEDPSFIYLMGEWESLEQHYTELHNMDQWKTTVAAMSKILEFQWMSHFDVPTADIQLDAPVLSLSRYNIRDGKKEDFAKTFEQYRHLLAGTVSEGKIASGWVLEEDQEGRKHDDFWALSPWKDVAQHAERTELMGTSPVSKTIAQLAEVDVKHVRLIKEF